ncbi:hypothetical protein PR202_ga20577 [Eleusine coracana subsp. coracana]|uniref:F-box protein AT5G49610-like beta-propeller domain-containing protein n=1 Tax=Eleusine coracana subsp. coracana TaxID=191504 RepID=A0AAV5CXI4_ELECO|nr:hypothetical protein PR202_ga20577 [Eleusine coracana subsp. coracana]
MAAELPLDVVSMSKVLGDDDLLAEILLRVDSPTSLVRAAAACKRWLRLASGRAFLRLFRARHPPGLLGFFVSLYSARRPVFVPMSKKHQHGADEEELAIAVRLASNLGFPPKSHVLDCRNGRVLVDDGVGRFALLDPLRRRPEPDAGGNRGTTAVLPPPPASPDHWHDCAQELLLPEHDNDRDASSCYCVHVDDFGGSVTARVSSLAPRPGGGSSWSWTVCSCAQAKRAAPPLGRLLDRPLLAGGKAYMLGDEGTILGIDLAASASPFVIELPPTAWS